MDAVSGRSRTPRTGGNEAGDYGATYYSAGTYGATEHSTNRG